MCMCVCQLDVLFVRAECYAMNDVYQVLSFVQNYLGRNGLHFVFVLNTSSISFALVILILDIFQ